MLYLNNLNLADHLAVYLFTVYYSCVARG